MMDKQAVVARVDLRQLAEQAGARFNQNNSSCCPLHRGDNPRAFHLYQGKDGTMRWHCFSNCPENANGGNAIDFYMRWRNVDFKTALCDLAQVVGVSLDSHQDHRRQGARSPSRPAPPATTSPISAAATSPSAEAEARTRSFVEYAADQLWTTTTGAKVLRYLRDRRGLSTKTITDWQLGFNPQNWYVDPRQWDTTGKRIWCPHGLVIPHYRNGKLWCANVRRPLKDGELADILGIEGYNLPKYAIVPRGGKRGLFGANWLRGLPILLVAEGEFDTMLAWQEAGDLCDVVTLGGARQHLDTLAAAALARAWVILVIMDDDVAGARGRAYLRSVSERVTTVQPPAHDLTDYWREGGDLRKWIAGQVGAQLAELLDKRQCDVPEELFVGFLDIYTHAADVYS